MKTKLVLISLLLTIVTYKAIAQAASSGWPTPTISTVVAGKTIVLPADTLNVYLERDSIRPSGVNLVLENNTCDTIFVMTRFENFNLKTTISGSGIGIYVNFYHDNKSVYERLDSGFIPAMFEFSKGFTLIYPKSNVKLFFEVASYFQFSYSENLEISFMINYLFTKYNHDEGIRQVSFFETNRVLMDTPDEVEQTIDNEV